MRLRMSLQVLAQTVSSESSPAVGLVAALPIIFLVIALVTSIFWIWMLIDCATNANLDGTHKLIWVLIILFLHFVGALIYFIVARGSRPKAAGS